MRVVAAPILGGVAVTATADAGPRGGLFVGTDGGIAHLGDDGSLGWLPWAMGAHVVAIDVDPTSGAVAVGCASGAVGILRDDGSMAEVDLGSRVRSLSWSSEGSTLAACSQLAGLLVCDLDGRRSFGLAPSRRWRHVAWQDGHTAAPLIVAGAGGASWVDARTGAVARHDRSDGAVTAVAVDPSGPWTAFGDLRGEVRMVDAREEGEVEVSGWPDAVEVLAWMPGTGRLLVAGGDEVTVWTAEVPAEADDEPDPDRVAVAGGRVTAIAPHPWLTCAAVGADDGRVVLWDTRSDAAQPVGRAGAEVTALRWDAMGEQLFVGTRDGGSWVPAMEVVR
jgi:hypothetical protein